MLLSPDNFAEWYVELGKLKIFWAKPVKDIHVIDEEGGAVLMDVKWIVRNRTKRAVLATAEKGDVSWVIEKLCRYDATRILILPEDLAVDLDRVDARGILYWWNVFDANTLEPNANVEVRTYRAWGDEELEIFRGIQGQSWGFFIAPRLNDHVVVVGFLDGMPVAMAYLNTHNFNIDYGVHVIKSHWRRRIGTRLLAELLKLARTMGSPALSVVRVFRSKRGTSSDIRALRFYRANGPSARISVYRLRSIGSNSL